MVKNNATGGHQAFCNHQQQFSPQSNFDVVQYQPNDYILKRGAELTKGLFVVSGNLRISYYGDSADPDDMPLYSAIVSAESFIGEGFFLFFLHFLPFPSLVFPFAVFQAKATDCWGFFLRSFVCFGVEIEGRTNHKRCSAGGMIIQAQTPCCLAVIEAEQQFTMGT